MTTPFDRDPLTGALTRRVGEQVVARHAEWYARRSLPLGFAFIDLDDLKKINTELGYVAGDEALRQVGRLLATSLRAFDRIIRWNQSDELLLVLPGVDVERARVVVDRIRKTLAERPIFGDLKLTVSAGIAELRREDTYEAALSLAIANARRAKQQGGNRVA